MPQEEGLTHYLSLVKCLVLQTGLTASAGVATNKFLAKLASEMEKPNGLCVIRPAAAVSILAGLPIERFHGVGPATARRLHTAGIASGADLQALNEAEATRRLGRQGAHFWRLAQGIDERPVQPSRQRQSLSVERTFAMDISGAKAVEGAIEALAEELATRLAQSGFMAATVTLKIKYRDFRLSTRQTTLPVAPARADELASAAQALLRRAPLTAPVRLLGIWVGGSLGPLRQLVLPLAPDADQDPTEAGHGDAERRNQG